MADRSPIFDTIALIALIDARIAVASVPPVVVSQRNVERIVGVSRREFLHGARTGGFPSSKIRRLIVAKTSDVVEWVDAHRRVRFSAARQRGDSEAAALAQVGARRVKR